MSIRSILLSLLLIAVSTAAQAPPADVERRTDLTFWESIKDSREPALLEEYLKRFPDGVFVSIAKSRLRDLRGATPAEGTKTPPAAQTLSPVAEPESLLSKVQRAMGGVERLRGVRDFRRVQQTSGKNVFGDAKKAPKVTYQWCSTGEMRFSQSGSEDFFNGRDKGWVAVKGKLREYTPTGAANTRASRRFSLLRLVAATSPEITVSSEGSMLYFRDGAANEVAMQIDPATHLPMRSTQTFIPVTVDGTAGRRQTSARRYEDWRLVNGIRLPFREVIEGNPPVLVSFLEWKTNVGVDCAKLGEEPRGVVRVQDSSPAVAGAGDIIETAEAASGDTQAEAKALIGRMQEAMGGVDRLLSVRDFQRTHQSTAEDFGGKDRKGKKITETWCRTGEYLNRTAIPLVADVLLYFDGTRKGWVVRGKKKGDLPEALAETARRQLLNYDVFNLVLADRLPNRTLSLLAANKLQVTDTEGNVTTVELDAALLPWRKTNLYVDKNGVSSTTETRFMDWRTVSGLRLPFAIEEYVRGRKIRSAAVLDWRVNLGTDCSKLSDPAYAERR